MKERPIIMQAESVRAILDGRKIQTRRIVNPQPDDLEDKYASMALVEALRFYQGGKHHKCPHGQPGDRLWVKEAWAMNTPPSGAIYKADGEVRDQKWKSPLFMPRWASRITLELVNVRVERVQDISRKDAKAEGFWPSPHNGLEMFDGRPYGNAQLAYKACWQSIHGKNPARRWEANPWVWVLEFKRVKP